MPGGTRVFEDDFNPVSSKHGGEADTDASLLLSVNEKENTRENNVAKIKVVVCPYVNILNMYTVRNM